MSGPDGTAAGRVGVGNGVGDGVGAAVGVCVGARVEVGDGVDVAAGVGVTPMRASKTSMRRASSWLNSVCEATAVSSAATRSTNGAVDCG